MRQTFHSLSLSFRLHVPVGRIRAYWPRSTYTGASAWTFVEDLAWWNCTRMCRLNNQYVIVCAANVVVTTTTTTTTGNNNNSGRWWWWKRFKSALWDKKERKSNGLVAFFFFVMHISQYTSASVCLCECILHSVVNGYGSRSISLKQYCCTSKVERGRLRATANRRRLQTNKKTTAV